MAAGKHHGYASKVDRGEGDNGILCGRWGVISPATQNPSERVLRMDLTPSPLFQLETMAKMEVKSSLLDNMIGVGDMVLLEPLNEETFIGNLKKRFDHNEIYVSACRPLWLLGPGFCGRAGSSTSRPPFSFLSSQVFLTSPEGSECLLAWCRRPTDDSSVSQWCLNISCVPGTAHECHVSVPASEDISSMLSPIGILNASGRV